MITLNKKTGYGLALSLALVAGSLAMVIAAIIKTGSAAADILITYAAQPAVFVAAAITALKIGKDPVKTSLQIAPCSAKYYGLGLLALFGLFFSVGYANGLFAEWLESVGVPTGGALAVSDLKEYVSYALALCVFPAVGEELLFRGLALFAMTRVSKTPKNEVLVSVFTALLFALYHKNAAQVLYQFAFGFALTLLAIRARSVFPSMFAHAVNNLFVLSMGYFFPTVNLFCWWAVLLGAAASAAALFVLVKGSARGKTGALPFLIGAAPGVIFCLAIAVLRAVGRY